MPRGLVGEHEVLPTDTEGRFPAPGFDVDPLGLGQASDDAFEPRHVVHTDMLPRSRSRDERESRARSRGWSYDPRMTVAELDFYASPDAMTQLPDHPALCELPADLNALRRCVQGLLVHRDWVAAYGIAAQDARVEEQQLRSTTEVLCRAFEICGDPITSPRQPIDRVLGICRHFTLVHTAFLRAQDIPARVRCGFSNYFDRSKWYDHWITERWDGARWVRDDPQIDDVQASVIKLDFDPYDQPPGEFLSGGEAWAAVRAHELDPDLFGIFDMWGLAFIAGNVLADVVCLNKVELLPWDSWGMGTSWGPYDALSDETVSTIDELADLTRAGEFEALRERYSTDEAVRVPHDITSFVDGKPVAVHLDL